MFDVITAPRASSIIYGLARGQVLQSCDDSNIGVWLLPANICPVVPLALIAAGTPFEFIDIDLKTLCIDIALVGKRFADESSNEVATILYSRSYGVMDYAEDDLNRLHKVAPDCLLIDDQALGIPNLDVDGVSNSVANVILFSSGYSKVANVGYGGYAFFNNVENYSPSDVEIDLIGPLENNKLYRKAFNKLYSSYDHSNKNDINAYISTYSLPVYDSRLSWDDLREEISSKVEECMEHKKKLNEIYSSRLSEMNIFPASYQNWRFNLFVENSSELEKEIFSQGLFSSRHYLACDTYFDSNDSYPVATMVADRIINLFNDSNFTEKQAFQVAKIIEDFYIHKSDRDNNIRLPKTFNSNGLKD